MSAALSDANRADLAPDEFSGYVQAQLRAWLEGALATDPGPRSAANLYGAALASVVAFAWAQFDGAADPFEFLLAITRGVGALVDQLQDGAPTLQ